MPTVTRMLKRLRSKLPPSHPEQERVNEEITRVIVSNQASLNLPMLAGQPVRSPDRR